MQLAEREGFEPPVPLGITGFQDQRHQPLGHLSISEPADTIIPDGFFKVNCKLAFRALFCGKLCREMILWQQKRRPRTGWISCAADTAMIS